MTFTYDASTSRGRVRLLISDTNASSYVFEDDEIDALLALADQNQMLAAAFGLRSLAADKAKFAVYYTVRGFMMDRRQAAQQMLALAKTWEERAVSTPFELESVLDDYIDTMGVDRSNYLDTPADES